MVPGNQWRYNVLLRTQDRSLTNTVAVSDAAIKNPYAGSPIWRPGISKQIVNSINYAPEETGIIPTAGIAAGGRQYMNFMSIKTWDNNGAWTTNYSAIATSADNGETWGVYLAPFARRPGATRSSDGSVPQTRPRRSLHLLVRNAERPRGSAYVSGSRRRRFPISAKYEYWSSDSNSWVPANPAAATPVIPGPVGEMSAQYNRT